MPHAILTIFLLDSGISLVQITIIQIIYMIVATISEVPSGYIADHWSRKNMYILSIVFLLISYVIIYFYYYNFWSLIIAWIIYAISASSLTGTLDNEIVNQLKEKKLNIKNFIVRQSYVLYLSSSISAIVGALLYKEYGRYIYILSFILLIISYFIATFFKEINFIKNEITIINIKDEIKLLINDKKLILYLLLYIILAFFYQPFYQYWQILFVNKKFSPEYFGFLYVAFNIISILSSFIFSKIDFKFYHSIIIVALVGIISLTSFSIDNKLFFLICFFLVIMLTAVYSINLQVDLRKYSPPEKISIISSLMGTGNTIGSFLILFMMLYTLNKFSIVFNYKMYFSIFSLLTIIILVINFKNYEKS